MSLFSYSLALEEKIKVQEEHHTQIDAEPSYFGTQNFNGILHAGKCVVYPEDKKSKAYIEQIKADFKKRIGCFCNILSSKENITHENEPVFKQIVRYDPGQDQGNGQIDKISKDDIRVVHD